MSPELLDLLKFVGGGSVAGLLFFFIYGGYKSEPWWVFANYHEKIVAFLQKAIIERDDQIKELKAENREHRQMTTKTVDVVEEFVRLQQRPGRAKRHEE